MTSLTVSCTFQGEDLCLQILWSENADLTRSSASPVHWLKTRMLPSEVMSLNPDRAAPEFRLNFPFLLTTLSRSWNPISTLKLLNSSRPSSFWSTTRSLRSSFLSRLLLISTQILRWLACKKLSSPKLLSTLHLKTEICTSRLNWFFAWWLLPSLWATGRLLISNNSMRHSLRSLSIRSHSLSCSTDGTMAREKKSRTNQLF